MYNEISEVVDEFAEELRSYTDSRRLSPLDVDIRVDDFRITGRLENIWESNLMEYRCVEKDRVRHHMDMWIDHVALNCVKKTHYPRISIFARIGSAWFFHPLEDARSELQKLLSYYLKGMTEPLKFFCKHRRNTVSVFCAMVVTKRLFRLPALIGKDQISVVEKGMTIITNFVFVTLILLMIPLHQ